jgi:hypothetical protein
MKGLIMEEAIASVCCTRLYKQIAPEVMPDMKK